MLKNRAQSAIENLCERYREHKSEYHLPEYNEQKTRQDFINPFFKALGWDIDNEKGASEAYREVIYEDKVVVRGKAKAPDYGFRLSGSGKKRLFFVEAKKPSVALKTNKDSAYQLKRYGSSAQVHVSILTNFEDFIVYDCTRVPYLNESASVSRLKHLHFEDYIKEFDFLYDTFSHEAVTKGRFDKFIQSDVFKKGTDTLDKRFVKSLDGWRLYLAKSIAFNNRHLTNEEINFSVQQTLDRIIFLRFCEARGVETNSQLQKAVAKGDSYKNLFNLFRQADDKYNSGLFDFKKDVITPKLKIDNKVLKIIINELYYPFCNYDFRVMPVEVLGNAYEQFLGKVIRTTPARSVKIEEKPEVRKAGGVFYTPQYIVEYIVKNTVGKLIAGKTPTQIEKIKIVDPACGSGSFLIGAFEYLLNYHINWYHEKGYGTKKGKDNPFTPQGTLTTHEKKRILSNNIFGVDLDANAVEVTKLSLLLKCMEGETEASIIQQISLFHERVLPNLDNNIKDGNSLIDTDFYDNEIDLGYEKTIKPFSWKKKFPNVFKNGGFDVVIGNPPYVQLAMYNWFDGKQKQYLLSKYCSSMGRMNTFGFFIEQGINLLSEKGKLGFIIPNTILTQEYYQELRKLILKETHIDNIVSYENLIFADAVVETTTLILSKGSSKAKSDISFYNKDGNYSVKTISQETYKLTHKNQFRVSYEEADALVKNKIDKGSNLNFNDIGEINQAIALKADRAAYLFPKKISEKYKPVLDGREILRYQTNWAGKYLKYDINVIHSCKREDIFLSKEKIFFRRVSASLIATLDTDQFYALNTLVTINKKVNVEHDIKFILGLFNSKLINYYYTKFLKSTKKVFSEIQARQIGELPVPSINFQKKEDKTNHDEIIKNVNLLLKLNKEIKSEKLPTKIDQLKSRIEYSEEKINKLVYELYNLSEKEIKIIEGGKDE